MKKRNKIFSLVLVLVIIAGVFTACKKAQPNSAIDAEIAKIPSSVTSKFAGLGSASDVLSDVKSIDLMHKLDETGLTIKNEKDDETDTSIDYMYKGDTLVYARYNGYGEDGFDYYTKSESGKDIKINYTDMNGKRDSVTVYGDDYFISFDELNIENEFGADSLQITLTEKVDANDVAQRVTYNITTDETSAYGYYFDNSGYHYCGAYPDGANYDTFDDVIFEKENNVTLDNIDFNALAKDERVDVLQLTVGQHELKYVSKGDGKDWYIEADVMAVCKDKKSADAVLKDYAKFDVELEQIGEKWVVEFDDATLPVSDKFESFGDFAIMEIDDYYYAQLVLDENNALMGLSRDNIMMSYY